MTLSMRPHEYQQVLQLPRLPRHLLHEFLSRWNVNDTASTKLRSFEIKWCQKEKFGYINCREHPRERELSEPCNTCQKRQHQIHGFWDEFCQAVLADTGSCDEAA